LLAHALGGEVGDNPNGRQVGTVDVSLTEAGQRSPLFRGLPPVLHVPVSHRQAVTRLPEGAIHLATSARDANHAFAYGERIFGVQFHPEFDANIVRSYIEADHEQLRAQGQDPTTLSRDAADTADGTLVLRNFAAIVRAHQA
jgi:GMP synthase (glutamine-hydrolysing)